MYHVFHRTWWRRNPSWPDGREPHMGEKTTIDIVSTEQEARQLCDKWNAMHDPGFLSRKAEYSSDCSDAIFPFFEDITMQKLTS